MSERGFFVVSGQRLGGISRPTPVIPRQRASEPVSQRGSRFREEL
jgi:hypothetical protein